MVAALALVVAPVVALAPNSAPATVLARNWRMIANSFGAKHTRICNEVETPPIPNFDEKSYLVMSDLTELCQVEHPRIKVPTERKLELVE